MATQCQHRLQIIHDGALQDGRIHFRSPFLSSYVHFFFFFLLIAALQMKPTRREPEECAPQVTPASQACTTFSSDTYHANNNIPRRLHKRRRCRGLSEARRGPDLPSSSVCHGGMAAGASHAAFIKSNWTSCHTNTVFVRRVSAGPGGEGKPMPLLL